MEEIFISLERMQELARSRKSTGNIHLAFVLGFDGRWKYSTWETYKSRGELSCKQ